MPIIERLNNAIQWELPLEKQLATMAQFDNITDTEIEQLFNCHKSFEVGYLLEYLGPARLQKYLPQFLQFLQDINWPGAGGAARMLRAAGEMAVPEVRRIFQEENDAAWIDQIILNVVCFWETEVVASLKPDLLHLIQNADREGNGTSSFKALAEKGLLTTGEKVNLYQQLHRSYSAMPDDWANALLSDLDEVMQEVS